MSAYERLFRHALYPVYESGLRGRSTLRYLREYERSQWLSRDEVLAVQWRKLQRLVAHCWEHVPYYRARWRELGIAGPADLRTREAFARLPVLTKPEIRANSEALVVPAMRHGLLFKSTGGSTGEPLRFGYTRESYERRIAVMHRSYGWAGARLGQRTLYVWGMPEQPTRKEQLYHAAFNRRMLDAFDMHDAQLPGYADAFARFRPETVVGYVAPLVRLAAWLEQTGRRVPRPSRILTAAEALHAPQRTLLERAFGCPVYNTYGCRECMLLASECTHGSLHTTADHILLETRAVPGAAADSPRDVVVTDLHNYGMPLLRYANGDLVTEGDGRACGCGRQLPTLRSVDGRKLDALYSADGRFVPGEMVVNAMLGTQGVRRYQAVQTALDRVELRVVRDVDFVAESLEPARDLLQRGLGPSARLELAFVDEIPLTPSGKHRVTVSELQ